VDGGHGAEMRKKRKKMGHERWTESAKSFPEKGGQGYQIDDTHLIKDDGARAEHELGSQEREERALVK